MTKRSRDDSWLRTGSLPPWVFQITGLGLLIGGCVYWAFTHIEPELLIAPVMSLCALGVFNHFAGRPRSTPDEEGDE